MAGGQDPVLTTINVHLGAMTRLDAAALTCHLATVKFGDHTQVTLFMDAAAIDRMTVVLAEAKQLLRAPSLPAAA